MRRGSTVEQFLGPVGSPGRPGVRYVEIRPRATSYEVYLHTCEDVGHETYMDLVEFPPFVQDVRDAEDAEEAFGELLGVTEDSYSALVLAEERTGAVRGRWVNEGLTQDEYRDFVRAGRPSGAWPAGRP
ncbi:hypothetical protein [Streptomyces laurentii]|uniref:hypothetical protein n=1 Tax=Streptomyces laurentii TaxID=39478 RepID=UPI00368046F2